MSQIPDTRIKYVASLLIKGEKRVEIIDKCKVEFKIGSRMVDKYIRLAKVIVKEHESALQKTIDEKSSHLIEQSENNILTTIRKRQLLKEIAEGNARVQKTMRVWDDKIKNEDGSLGNYKYVGVNVMPTHSERIMAIQADNAMSGDNAPEKHDVKVQQIIGVRII